MGVPHKTSTRTYKTINVNHTQTTLAVGHLSFLN